MNRNHTIIALLTLVAAALVGGCGRTVARANSDAGLMAEQLPTFHEAREDYLLWARRSGASDWQRGRARELEALRGVGQRPD